MFLLYFIDHRPDSMETYAAANPLQQLPSFSTAFAHQRNDNRIESFPPIALNVITAESVDAVEGNHQSLPVATPAIPVPRPNTVINRPQTNKKPFLPPIIRLVSSKKKKSTEDASGNIEDSLQIGFEYFSKQKTSDQHNADETEANRVLLRSMWTALPSIEKQEFVTAAKRERENDENQVASKVQPPVEIASSSDKSLDRSSTHQSTVHSASPTLQEYPADYETILIDFE